MMPIQQETFKYICIMLVFSYYRKQQDIRKEIYPLFMNLNYLACMWKIRLN